MASHIGAALTLSSPHGSAYVAEARFMVYCSVGRPTCGGVWDCHSGESQWGRRRVAVARSVVASGDPAVCAQFVRVCGVGVPACDRLRVRFRPWRGRPGRVGRVVGRCRWALWRYEGMCGARGVWLRCAAGVPKDI